MPFNDDQFKQFMEALTQTQKNWELLIRIDENTKNLGATVQKHINEDSGEFGAAKVSLTKIHERIDKVKEDIIKVDGNVNGIKNRIIGAAILASLIISGVQIGISVYHAKETPVAGNYENTVRRP